jgi:hypothetical protein
VTAWPVKRCPRCGRVRPTREFRRRRSGRLSSYCQFCQRAAAHLARRRRRKDPGEAEQLRVVDRARQRRRRTVGGPGPSGGDAAMSRQSTVAGRLVAEARGGRAAAAAATPFLVLDLGRGCDPHQARCRRCRWRSRWRTTAAQAQVEHASHQAAAHGRRRQARRGGLRLVAWGRAR